MIHQFLPREDEVGRRREPNVKIGGERAEIPKAQEMQGLNRSKPNHVVQDPVLEVWGGG